MKILIVDDDKWMALTIKEFLVEAGYEDILVLVSGKAALEYLKVEQQTTKAMADLILLDLVMPEIDGIKLCKRIKEVEAYQSVPVIMVTSGRKEEYLEKAFAAQAMDFLNKPIVQAELLARVKSALDLRKRSVEQEKQKAKLLDMTNELSDINQNLVELAGIDELTQIPDKRSFDKTLDKEWKRAKRSSDCISLVLIDVDYFKSYNDNYGHAQSDICLQKIAKTLKNSIKRAGDFLARYKGEKFAIILSSTNSKGAKIFAEKVRQNVESQKIPNKYSQMNQITISLGVTTVLPELEADCKTLLEKAHKALYDAKNNGGNQCFP